MGNLSLILGVFCTLCWVSVSVFEFHTVVVQPSEEVTLQCSNFCSFPAHIFWFKLANGSNSTLISSMFTSESRVSLREGFQNGKFTMTSNRTDLFLSIKWVDFSDPGLYTCGTSQDIFSATYLQVQVDVFSVPFWIMCAASVFLLILVICLVAKIRRVQTAQADSKTQQQNKNPDSDTLNYAALNFHSKPKRNRLAEAEDVLETNVVYAATR
ncbi:hypothetical protein ATANTOWER_016251 [Ataeniobius toweri]|uniref:Ig-like domain-containing protein n=1 Tax=Ataeniobius toweri TaxID=208326 RepID=A0ABU7ARV8_9TELE|nr:hypothetical protein [Ataeniobius toweri]